MSASQLGPRGEVVLPLHVRRKLGVKPGDRVVFSLLPDGGVSLRSANDGEDGASLAAARGVGARGSDAGRDAGGEAALRALRGGARDGLLDDSA